MDESEIQAVLDVHVSELRDLTIVGPGPLPNKEALARLDAFWKRTCRLARIADSEQMGAIRRTTVQAIVKLSRETVAALRPALTGSSSGYWSEEEGEGGGGVPVGLNPMNPPRAGRDAKPLPHNPEDIEWPRNP
jgi:hypothetical protein